jgi:hypothetical protein
LRTTRPVAGSTSKRKLPPSYDTSRTRASTFPTFSVPAAANV